MKQIILRNFIDDTVLTNVMKPIPSASLEQQKDYVESWLLLDTLTSNQIPTHLQEFVEYVPTKLNELQQLSVNVAKITRAGTKNPKAFVMDNKIPTDTSYILFISTQTSSYEMLPITFNSYMPDEGDEFISLPITLNAGDAFLTEYTSESSNNLTVYSPELQHLCVVYLEPKELWP